MNHQHLARLAEDQPQRKLIDQTPAAYIEGETARLCEHDTSLTRQFALHLVTTSTAQVIADDIAAGEQPFGPTVARYVYARDQYRECLLRREASRG